MIPLSHWSADDLVQYKQLDDFLSKKATWNVTTSELVNVYRSLVWFANMKTKIENSQVEIISVKHPEPTDKKKPK